MVAMQADATEQNRRRMHLHRPIALLLLHHLALFEAYAAIIHLADLCG